MLVPEKINSDATGIDFSTSEWFVRKLKFVSTQRSMKYVLTKTKIITWTNKK